MKYILKSILSLFIVQLLVNTSLVVLPELAIAAQSSAKQGPPTTLSQKELEKIAQPIALYPDILLQQVLAASTFPEQILDAAIYNEQGKSPESIKDQPWDDSVKGVANYPSVLSKLASDLDWTITLGSAFINQNEELRNVIQTLRARAKTVGNLKDSEQQHVVEEKSQSGTTIIRIEPAEPEIVYVPTTTTAVVYSEPVSQSNLWAPVATFGLGMALGYAMGDDDDDNYYYGGGGYYGPGFWHGNAADDWVDYRRDRWDDAYDFANDRQDWRQDNADDWREHRQDLARKQQDWRNEQKARFKDMSPEQRAQARTKAGDAKAKWQGSTPDQRKQALQDKGVNKDSLNQDRINQVKANRPNSGTFSKTGSANYGSANINRESASQRLDQARSNPELQKRSNNYRSSPQVQQRAQSAKSNYQSRTKSSGGSYARGGGLSGMNSGGFSANRSQSRGSMSRGSFGGGSMSRGGGGFRGGGGRRR